MPSNNYTATLRYTSLHYTSLHLPTLQFLSFTLHYPLIWLNPFTFQFILFIIIIGGILVLFIYYCSTSGFLLWERAADVQTRSPSQDGWAACTAELYSWWRDHYSCSGEAPALHYPLYTLAKPAKPKFQLRGRAQVDVPLSVSHTCVWSHSRAL